jgi:hypothetical protein
MEQMPTFPSKEWLTLEQAAKRLGDITGEEVTVADVLRLALDKQIRLSVRFLTLAKVKHGEIVRYSRSKLETSIAAGVLPTELKWQLLSPEEVTSLPNLPDEVEGQEVLVIRYLKLDADHYVKFVGKIKTIEGIWDLPMIGGERVDIEERYQQLTNGPPLKLSALEGVIIQGQQEELYQLQEQISFNEYSSKWDTEHRELKEYIVNEADQLLRQHKEERKQILKMMKGLSEEESYYPSRRLPKDSNLVVRQKSVLEFENLVKTQNLNSHSLPIDPSQYDLYRNSCVEVSAEKIRQHFRVKTNPDENLEWWKKMMRNASDNGLLDCRVGAGVKGGVKGGKGSMWRPDLIAGWLVDRWEKGRDGLDKKAAAVALRKFPGCEEVADTFFPGNE